MASRLPEISASRRSRNKKIFVGQTKELIKNAPEFHRVKHLGDAGYREELGTYYRPDTPSGGQPIV
ncbi:hypothetical protein [Streptomyces mirabilis]|uniref:hypothetical protein n=1 Tax=Streptomyces mirabilis TaxID=68239 RepID=UPI0036814536